MFAEKLMNALKEQSPNVKEESLRLYIKHTDTIYREVFGLPFNEKTSQLKLPWKKIEDYFDERGYAPTTRGNYWSSLFNVLSAMNYNPKITSSVKMMRDKYKDEYKAIKDGLKSQKQEDNFVSAKLLNGFIDDYAKQIKEGSEDRDVLQIWIILKLLREYSFRNEIATLEFVSNKEYQMAKKKDEKRNMIVMSKGGWFISKQKYKTDKIYGEEVIDIEGEMLKDLKKYHKLVGNGMLLRSAPSKKFPDKPQIMTPNGLSKYLIKWSNKNVPPLVLDDGTKKPRNLSTTMIVKAYQSAKHGGTKAELEKDSKNRGNQPTTMLTKYVSSKTPKV